MDFGEDLSTQPRHTSIRSCPLPTNTTPTRPSIEAASW